MYLYYYLVLYIYMYMHLRGWCSLSWRYKVAFLS